jgi:membrane fusion protein
MFGTYSAVVTSISETALVPHELSVPIAIDGPVFEVRATLLDRSIEALGASWPLTPGLSFRAAVIQRRLRLYQWFFRALIGRESDDRD